MKLSLFSLVLSLGIPSVSAAWVVQQQQQHHRRAMMTRLDMAAVGIFYGTSTGSTSEVANLIYQAFGNDIAAPPVDVDTVDGSKLAGILGEHQSLVVGTPTWNTGADTERSGTGWDELYYSKLPSIKQVLNGKKVAVFGLGDQVSYSENYADATGELFDVFEGLGCRMLGAWSQEGYNHDASKSIRGDKFCGLLLDAVNQEELTEERVEKWVAQLVGEGILEGGGAAGSFSATSSPVNDSIQSQLEEQSGLLDASIETHSSGGYTPHHNPVKDSTMWTSSDGRKSFVTAGNPATENSGKVAP